MSYILQNKLTLPSNRTDSMGRIRTSNTVTYFDSPLKHHDEPFLWDTVIDGNASSIYDNNESILKLSVSQAGDSVIRQTKEYFQLQNGKSHQGFAGVVLGSPTSNVVKKCGVYDDSNGIYLMLDDTGVNIVFRSKITGSVQETIIPRDSWNIDKLDGAGKSSINIDFSKLQIISIDFSFTGNTSCRIGLLVNDAVVYFHQISSLNLYDTNAFSTPSLPLRYEISSTGGVSTLKQQSSCILVEGDYTERGVRRSVNTGTESIRINSRDHIPVISLRLKPEFRKSMILPKSIGILHTSNLSTLYYEIIIYNTLSGANWIDVDNASNSISQYDTSATESVGGIIISSGYIPASKGGYFIEELDTILKLTGNFNNTTHSLSIVLRGLDSFRIPCYASINYIEIF